MSEESKLELYHYLDEDKLDSLYAQCGEFVVECLTQINKQRNIDGDVEVEIGKLLSMFGLGGAKVDGKISVNRLKTESMKSVFRVEQRIPIILSFLKERNQLQRLELASNKAKDGYTIFNGSFKTPDFQEVLQKSKVDSMAVMFAALSGDKDRLKPQGFVEFVCNASFGTITMGSSLAKYKTGLQHLMNMWKDSNAEPGTVRLNVFGYLSSHETHNFYLKPFAIAQW